MVPGAFEILIILFVILLVIGPRRIANLGRSLGRGVRDFRVEFGRDKRAVSGQQSALGKDEETEGRQGSDTEQEDSGTTRGNSPKRKAPRGR